MRFFISLLFTLISFSSQASVEDCNKLFFEFAFESESLVTNASENFDLDSLKRMGPYQDHLETYVKPLDGIFQKIFDQFSSEEKFTAYLLDTYGLTESDLKWSWGVRGKIRQLYDQKRQQLESLRQRFIELDHNKHLSYSWVISFTLRFAYIMDVFDIPFNIDSSIPIRVATDKFRKDKLKAMLNARVLSSDKMEELLGRYENPMKEGEYRHANFLNAMRAFPDHKIIPYIGSLSDLEIGNAIMLGVHYVELAFGQPQAHGAYYSTDDFLRHDFGHMDEFVYHLMPEDVEATLNGPNIERLRRWVRRYIVEADPSRSDIEELQRFFFLVFRETPENIDSLIFFFLRGDLSRFNKASYLNLTFNAYGEQEGFDEHWAALEKFFNWMAETQQAASSGSGQRF